MRHLKSGHGHDNADVGSEFLFSEAYRQESNKVNNNEKISFDLQNLFVINLFSLKSLTKRAKKLIELSHEQTYFEKPFFSQMNDFIRDLLSESLLQVHSIN